MIIPLGLTFYPFVWLDEYIRRRRYLQAEHDGLLITSEDLNGEFDELFIQRNRQAQ
jgi:hypothetical protein